MSILYSHLCIVKKGKKTALCRLKIKTKFFIYIHDLQGHNFLNKLIASDLTIYE